MNELLNRLYEAGTIGSDMSPGDELALEAHSYISRLLNDPDFYKSQRQGICEHKNTTLRKEGFFVGTVICHDCGYERDWGAY